MYFVSINLGCCHSSSTSCIIMQVDKGHATERLRKERETRITADPNLILRGVSRSRLKLHYESDQRVPDLEYLDGVILLGVDKVFAATGLATKVRGQSTSIRTTAKSSQPSARFATRQQRSAVKAI